MLYPIQANRQLPSVALTLRSCSLPALVPSKVDGPWARWIAGLPPASPGSVSVKPVLTADERLALQCLSRNNNNQGSCNTTLERLVELSCTPDSSSIRYSRQAPSADELMSFVYLESPLDAEEAVMLSTIQQEKTEV